MKLNEKKTQFMIINYTYDYQFNTRIHINETLLECVNKTLLLGVLIQDNLGYDGHVRLVCKKAYSRMSLITKLIKFGASVKDLITIYIIFMRSVLEYCAVVWHSSLTLEQSQDIERVQKVAIRTILKSFDIEYSDALEKVKLERLDKRREQLCLKFAVQCTKSEKNKDMFPLQPATNHCIRRSEKYIVPMALTDRYKNSSIPYMANLLNKICLLYTSDAADE